MMFTYKRFFKIIDSVPWHLSFSLQVWRLVTNFMYFGPIGFNFLLNIIVAYRFCRMLEEGSFRNKTADFFYMILSGATLMIVSFLKSQLN